MSKKKKKNVRNKTSNEHLNNIAEAVAKTGKTIGDKVNEQIEASVLA